MSAAWKGVMVLITVKSIFQLGMLIIAGMAASKLKLVTNESTDSINAILMHLALPALLLRSFQSDILFNNKALLLPTLGISALVQFMSIALGFVFVRRSPNANIERASIGFTNNSFVGIPLLTSMFAETGSFYGCTFNAISSLVFFSVLPAMITGSFSLKDCIRKTLNDKVFVCIFATILLAADIRIPEFIMTPVGWLADITTPLAMVLIGCIIANSDFSHLFNMRAAWITVLRLIVTPLITGCILIFLIGHDTAMLLSFCTLAATPTGALVTIYTEQSRGNTALSSGIFLMTTVASAVTIPIIILLVEQALLIIHA